MANDKVYIKFDDIFDRGKERTQLKGRGLGSDIAELIALTDSEKDIVLSLYSEGVDDLRNRLGVFTTMKNYDSLIVYELTEKETEQKFKNASGLLEKALLAYMLFAWYESISQYELASVEKGKYEQYIKDIKAVSTRAGFVSPKFRPYF